MPVPTAPTTAVAGQPTRASLQFNALAAQAAWLILPPIAVVYQTVAQSIPNAAYTSVLMDTETVDRDSGHSIVSNTSRYNAVTAGWYKIDAHVGFAANATGRRLARLAVNGTAVPGTAVGGALTATAAGPINVYTGGLVFLNVADYVEVQAFQDSTAALLTSVLSNEQFSSLHVLWVSS